MFSLYMILVLSYSFYLVSAVMTSFDLSTNESKTVNFIRRGDSYGENCFLNGEPRLCTTISKEPIEFLTLKDEVKCESFETPDFNFFYVYVILCQYKICII